MMHHHSKMLPDGQRLHLQHGPIDLIIGAEGERADVARAYRQADMAFGGLLERLVAELPALRTAYHPACVFTDPLAQKMAAAVAPFASVFVTPMAAVAGCIADEVCTKMVQNCDLKKAYVNNGGDIALYLNQGQSYCLGIVSDSDNPAIDMTARIENADPIRGIASSGWKGRSHSFGVADVVTVLASDSASADVAATLIANSVDPGHCPEVVRQPAQFLDPDTDLGQRLVTMNVEELSEIQISKALKQGEKTAKQYVDQGLIHACAISLQGHTCIVGHIPGAGQIGQRSVNHLEGARV